MKKILVLAAMSGLLIACSEDGTQGTQKSVSSNTDVRKVKVARNEDFAQISKGGQLFQQHCAQCHGSDASGDPNWRQRDSNDKFPPPPLNGSGHAWHHPTKALKTVIRNGTQRIGGNMPPWKDKLSDSDMDAIIAWFQSKWSDEIYTAWYEIEQRSKH